MKLFDYNKMYYEGGLTGFHKASFPEIAAVFEAEIPIAAEKSEILDFGCGDGFYGAFLSEKAAVADGVDFSYVLSSHPNRHFYRSFEQVDLGQNWNPINRYDVVFSSEVIEHVQDYRQFLQNAFSALKPGGYLFLTTTTYFWYLFILLIVFRRRTSPKLLLQYFHGLAGNERARTKFLEHFWDYSGGHYHGFSKRQLRRASKKAGFSIEALRFLHIEKVFPVKYLNQPYQGRHAWLVKFIVPLLKTSGSLINWICEHFDIVASNVAMIARKPDKFT